MAPPFRPLRCRVAAAVALVLAGCAGGHDDAGVGPRGRPGREQPAVTAAPSTVPAPAAPAGTPGVTSPASAGAGPATTGGTPPAAAPPAAGGPACPPVPARAQPPGDRPRYTLRVDVRPAENAVVGDVAVRFTPDVATDRLVFRLWANNPRLAAAGARLDPGDVRVDGRPVAGERPDPTTLVVPLGRTVAAGTAVDAAVAWRLRLPGDSGDRIARIGDTVRLGSFFPILGWEPGVGWAADPPTAGFAEASTAPTADFDLSVTVPDGLQVLASGVPDGAGRWRATAMRDVALSVGRFRLVTGTAHAPDPVSVTVGVGAGVAESPQAYLDKEIRVLEDFGHRFGPYPWPVFTLAVTPGLAGGIEYPSHVMQGPGRLGRTTSHEVAHQWFYALVGNNQGRDPWLDEGLASYGEARFENAVAEFLATAVPPEGRGRLGEPMSYWELRRDAYYRSVYVQGVQALVAVGDPAFVDCALRHYVAVNAHRVARTGDLVAALRTVFPDAAATLARFGVR